MTQLPASTHTIAKAESIPAGYLAKLFQQLGKAGIVKSVASPARGYIFAKQPEDINLRELFEVFEGSPLFDDCLLKHCHCGGTPEICRIYAEWHEATQKMIKIFEGVSVASAAWSHPEHRFNVLPDLLTLKK